MTIRSCWNMHSFVLESVMWFIGRPVELNGTLLPSTEANWATNVMKVGIGASVFTGCTRFSLEKRLVTLRKKVRFARMFVERLGVTFIRHVGFASWRGFSLACPFEAHAPVQYLGISQKLLFQFDAVERFVSHSSLQYEMCCLFSKSGLYWHRITEDGPG